MSDSGTTTLHLLSKEGDLKTLQTALKNGNPNVGDNDGMTPIHYAAWYGHPLCIIALIEAGGDYNAFDNDGATPLHAAAYNGQLASVVTLVEAGADALKSDNENKTPKDVAAEENQIDCKNFLEHVENDQLCDAAVNRIEAEYNQAKENSKQAKLAMAKASKEAMKLVSEISSDAKKLAKQTLRLKKQRKKAQIAKAGKLSDRRSSTNSTEGSSFQQMIDMEKRRSSDGNTIKAKTKKDVDMVLAQIGADTDDITAVNTLLQSLDLKEFSRLLASNGMTIDKLRKCEVSDLKSMGLPQGASKKIVAAFNS